MTDPEKTVFLSYRREPSKYLAAYMYNDLRQHGYDVFWDISGIDSGDFAQAILNQIAARMHFVILLSPESLKRCSEPGDWLRREIEHAMDLQRNIVPVLADKFDFKSKATKRHLTGKLANLPRYNALEAPYSFLEEAVVRLRTRYLVPPQYPVVITPTPPEDELVVERKQAEAEAQPVPTEQQLTWEDYFRRAVDRADNDYTGKIDDYTEAIRLNPNNAEAHHNRADAWYRSGNLDGAINDYTEAIRLDPNDSIAHNNLGDAWWTSGDLDSAIYDYNEAIRLNPNYANPHMGLGGCYYATKRYKYALRSYERYLELAGDNVNSFVVERVQELRKKLNL